MDVTIRKPTNELEKEWLQDDDRFFNDDWEEELGIVVPHCSSQTDLIAEVDGEMVSIRITAPDFEGEFAERVVAAILERFTAPAKAA